MSIAGKLEHRCGLLDRSVVCAVVAERLFAATLVPETASARPCPRGVGSVRQSPGAQSNGSREPSSRVSRFSLESCARQGPAGGEGGATSSRSPLPAASVVCPQGYAGWPLSVPRGMLGGLWPSPAARWPPGSQGPGTRGLKGSAAAADLGLLEGHASGRGARGLGGAVAPLGSRGSLTPPAGRSGGAQCKGPGPSLEWGLCGRVPFSFTLRWLCLGRRSIPQSPISS